jgi:DNA-binding XRE family transcriptional regulator
MAKRTIYSADYELLLRMLREARERADVTQVTLAQRLGITQSALSKCERGELRLDVVQTRN